MHRINHQWYFSGVKKPLLNIFSQIVKKQIAMSVSSWWILKLLTETGKYLGKKRKSNLEVLARNLSLETSQNRVSGLTWYETNLLGRSFHVVQNLYYGCNDEDNRTNDQPYREKRFLDIDWYHLRLFYCYCFSAECPNIIQCLKICFQEDVFVLHCFFCEYPKIQFGLVGLLHTYNEPEPSLG